MAANASTWFYAEPEHRAYFLEERVNHTFWSDRIGAIYFDCISENPPFRMAGQWDDLPVTIEWVPNEYFKLFSKPGDRTDLLIVGVKEILGFLPTISYVDVDGQLVAEWLMKGAEQRIQQIQGDPKYRSVKRYKA
jgi:hypothetical protein